MATLQLNPREKQLKGLLLDVAAYIDKSGTQKPAEPVILRWAGGWVRDKVLGIDSHDIDTAINILTGEAFALKLGEFCKIQDNITKHSIGEKDVGRLHTIAKNPDKSKHLETTTIRLFGLDIDFVNLRRETYADDSRNPQMEFGTAEEDALRRDATVNALFYNLHTSEIEDFTGGMRDMEAQVMRTPMAPFQTFMDDPLRVLRLIRFASRLGFTIDPAAEQAMSNAEVLEALRLKISRERVGVELEKMLKGKTVPCHADHVFDMVWLICRPTGEHPSESLRLIDKLDLYHTIFTDPTNLKMPKPDISNWSAVYRCLNDLQAQKAPDSLYDILVTSDEAVYSAWVLAAIIPWAQIPGGPPKKPGAKRPPPFSALAAREGIKAPNKLSDTITAACRHREDILKLKEAVCNQEPCMNERDRFGMAVIEWDSKGGQWRLQVLAALFYDVLVRQKGEGAESSKPYQVLKESESHQVTNMASDINEILDGWRQFLDHLKTTDLMEVPSMKRLVDGKQLSKELGIKPGKWMTGAMEVCLAWQLRNPEETDAAGAILEVRKRKKELGLADLLKS